MKKKVTERMKFLQTAKKDVAAGMCVKDFEEKYSKDKSYDEDDWLFLRNLTQPKSNVPTNNR